LAISMATKATSLARELKRIKSTSQDLYASCEQVIIKGRCLIRLLVSNAIHRRRCKQWR
ncbi:hypothetical protein CFOL_v3_29757, partial [Cephalotus follicularis]